MSHIASTKPGQLSVELAATKDDLLASQLLRYQIFAEEQGAILSSAAEGIDRDHYDPHCHHLLVRDLASGMLWLGLAQFMELHKIDYMFGCASVCMRDGGSQVTAIMNEARRKHLAPSNFWVTPREQLMPVPPAERLRMPPLLKAYLKLGAWVAGEPCLDRDFNVADIFILLDVNNLNARYHRHFVQCGA